MCIQRARGKVREVEASPEHERYARQRNYIDRSYRSPTHANWNQARYYTSSSPQHGRSGSPAYTRLNRGQHRAWHTPDGQTRVQSPNYGESGHVLFDYVAFKIDN